MCLSLLGIVLRLPFAFVLQLKYTKSGKDNLKNYGVVMDTPVYVTAIQSSINASDVSRCPRSLSPQLPSLFSFCFMWFTRIELTLPFPFNRSWNTRKITIKSRTSTLRCWRQQIMKGSRSLSIFTAMWVLSHYYCHWKNEIALFGGGGQSLLKALKE